MADQFDRASDLEELDRQSAINLQQKQARPAAYAVGHCLYCYEPLPVGYRWCDSECRDDWEKEQKLK